MSENSKQKSTVTLEDSVGSIGGLILVFAVGAVIFTIIGIAKAATIFLSGKQPTTRG